MICFQNLKNEITRKLGNGNGIKIFTGKPKIEQHVIPQKEKDNCDIEKLDVESWRSEDVRSWLKECNLPDYIVCSYGKLDGSSLKQLYRIYITTPEFFFQSILKETNNQACLSDISIFISKLDSIFNKNNLFSKETIM